MTLDHAQVLRLLPDRDENGHKGDFGKLLLLCGSRGYTGAAYLSAMGALRCGAGLVYLGVPESIYAIEAVKLNEPVVFPLPDRDGKLSEAAVPHILDMLPRMDAVLIGPGIGRGEDTACVVENVLRRASCPVIVDADALFYAASMQELLYERLHPTILTPHDGEFLRFGEKIGENRMQAAGLLAKKTNSIVLLKGHRTCITDGKTECWNHTGNAGMATGGSGDVLAGMITALAGLKMEPLQAAACGAWLHGAAGDLAAAELGQMAMLPSDLLAKLPKLLK